MGMPSACGDTTPAHPQHTELVSGRRPAADTDALSSARRGVRPWPQRARVTSTSTSTSERGQRHTGACERSRRGGALTPYEHEREQPPSRRGFSEASTAAQCARIEAAPTHTEGTAWESLQQAVRTRGDERGCERASGGARRRRRCAKAKQRPVPGIRPARGLGLVRWGGADGGGRREVVPAVHSADGAWRGSVAQCVRRYHTHGTRDTQSW